MAEEYNPRTDPKLLLATSARIAAGMCAHPQAHERTDWQSSLAFDATTVALKLITLAYQRTL